MSTRITFDPAKRERTLTERGVDFNDAGQVFAAPHFSRPDERKVYGELRIITVGHLAGRMMVIIWTPRGDARHVISMRKANVREQAQARKHLD